MDHEVEYLRRRETRERAMARRARCKRARQVHHHLAGIYATRRAAIAPPRARSPTIWQMVTLYLRRLCGRTNPSTKPVF